MPIPSSATCTAVTRSWSRRGTTVRSPTSFRAWTGCRESTTSCRLALALETLMEIEVPPRAQYLRVAMCEMNRILNHLMFFASFGAELGAITPTFYAFREREDIQIAMEMATGGRMHFGFFRPGGLKEDVHARASSPGAQGCQASHRTSPRLREPADRQRDLQAANRRCRVSCRRMSPTPTESPGRSRAVRTSTSTSARTSRTSCYDQFDFDVHSAPNGDCFDRFWVLAARGRRVGQDRRAGHRGHAGRARHGQGAPRGPGAQGRGLRAHRELPRRTGHVPRVRRRPEVPTG